MLESPQTGQVFAFKCLQIGPDCTPQMTQYAGELKSIKDDDAVLLIVFDENEGKDCLDKFQVDNIMVGVVLKNREVEFKLSLIHI